MSVKEVMQQPVGFTTVQIEADPKKAVLITDARIQARVSHLVRYLKPEIRALSQPPLFLWLAKGARQMSVDLQFHLHVGGVVDSEFCPVKYTLYEGTQAVDVPKLIESEEFPFPNVNGRPVYIVDDILDTLATASECMSNVAERGGTVVGGIFLAEKPESSPWRKRIRVAEWPEGVKKWSLFSVPDVWLEGHGMDTFEVGRENPDVIVRWDMDKEKRKYYLKLQKALENEKLL